MGNSVGWASHENGATANLLEEFRQVLGAFSPHEDPRQPVNGHLRHAEAGAAPVVPLMIRALQEHESPESSHIRVLHGLQVHVQGCRLLLALARIQNTRECCLEHPQLQCKSPISVTSGFYFSQSTCSQLCASSVIF